MARFKSMADIQNFYKKQELLYDKYTPYPLSVSLRTGGRPKGGYLSKLARNQKKIHGQLRGLPGCGPSIKDWLVPY